MFDQLPQLPQDLKRLNLESLKALAEELRQVILSVSLKNGGHLGASLGTVELALALHYVFESPRDALVWDVGHQAYAHKLLTGRRKQFGTLRQTGGLSGFLSRFESEHDFFGAGHSSTALSGALGISHARQKNWTVAIVGDGGMTAGLALEALGQFKNTSHGPFVLLLNDNQMSISPNVGAISSILSQGRAREFFDLFGFDYVGPLDGHDLASLIGTLNGVKQGYQGRPVVVHALTQKGKGYAPAEESPASFHGVSPVQSKSPGQGAATNKQSFSDAFGRAMVEIAAMDPKVVAISAAMTEGTGLVDFANRFPERFFDVGIAEQHAVTFAAGLATQGLKPVVAIYSTFLQRALDQVIHDVVLQKLPVVFAIDRAGVVGADGPTHHGSFDVAYLKMIPGIKLGAPSTLSDVKAMLKEALALGSPCAIRYPRGSGIEYFTEPVNDRGFRWLHPVKEPAAGIVVSLGTAGTRVESALAGFEKDKATWSHVNVYWYKPAPLKLIEELKRHSSLPLLIVEDGSIEGGFGQSILSLLNGRTGKAELAGYQDHFIPHGSVTDLEEMESLSARALTKRLQNLSSSQ